MRKHSLHTQRELMQPSVNNTGAAQTKEWLFGKEGFCHPPLNLSIPVAWQPQNCLSCIQFTVIYMSPSKLITQWCKGKGCQRNYGVSGAPTPTLVCSPWTLCYKHQLASRNSFQERPWMLWGMACDGAGRCSSLGSDSGCATRVNSSTWQWQSVGAQHVSPHKHWNHEQGPSEQDQKYVFSFVLIFMAITGTGNTWSYSYFHPITSGWRNPDGLELIPVCSDHWAKGEKKTKGKIGFTIIWNSLERSRLFKSSWTD